MNLKSKFIQRIFWNLILRIPQFLRAKIVRSRFEASYDLDSNLVFKAATTKDEIEQAMNLVYDAYINLNYIDENPDQLHFNKYLTLPTTTILVIKYKEEVVGTMSIVMDSSFGLPTDATWNIGQYRKNGMSIAEISALTIKRTLKSNKGHLLLPLCRLMYHYCTEILKLDGIIIATTFEVEPFYLDLLMFEKIPDSKGQRHSLVKGNKSSCCFLKLDQPLRERYFKIYGHKELKFNLHHYFLIAEIPNIKIPKRVLSIQAQLKEKNQALVELLHDKPHLFNRLSEKEQLIITNLEPEQKLAPMFKGMSDRKHPRLVTMINGRIEAHDSNLSIPVKIVDVSQSGLKIKLLHSKMDLGLNEKISIKLDRSVSKATFYAEIMWIEKDQAFGCLIDAKSEYNWLNFYNMVWNEVQESTEEIVLSKKAA